MFSIDLKKKYVDEAYKSSAKEVSQKYKIPLKSLKRWMLVGPDRKKGIYY